jgi:glutaredoxin 3
MKNLVIFGHDRCRWCLAARSFATAISATYEYHDIRKDKAAVDLLDARLKAYSTVPQIFADDIYIGGYDDLVAAYNSGLLSAGDINA